MGRQYKGLDYRKVTVRLDERQFDIVRHYGWKQQERVYAEQDRTGKQKPYSWKMSDVIHDAINLLGRYVELSDNMETSAANLIDMAAVFDQIDGDAAPVYAQAIRQAAALLLVFCENAECGFEDGKLVFRAISQTKRNKYHETEIVVSSANGEPLDHQISQDRDKGPSEAQQGPPGGPVALHTRRPSKRPRRPLKRPERRLPGSWSGRWRHRHSVTRPQGNWGAANEPI